MTDLAWWTRIAIGVLVGLPPVIFLLFLRDAVRLLREIGSREPPEDHPAADAGPPADA